MGTIANENSSKIYLTGKSVLSILLKYEYNVLGKYQFYIVSNALYLDIVVDGKDVESILSAISEQCEIQNVENNTFMFDSHKFKLTTAILVRLFQI